MITGFKSLLQLAQSKMVVLMHLLVLNDFESIARSRRRLQVIINASKFFRLIWWDWAKLSFVEVLLIAACLHILVAVS